MTINFVSHLNGKKRVDGRFSGNILYRRLFFLHEMATVDSKREEKAPHFVYVSPSFGIHVEEAIPVIAALYLIR